MIKERLTLELLLIQPPVMRPIAEEEPIIKKYFHTLEQVGTFLGDCPTEPNLGLLLIASFVRKNFPHWRIAILDLNVEEREIRKSKGRPISIKDIENILGNYRASVVGLSFMTSSFGLWGKKLTEICRDKNPDAFIILGGIHPTVQYKEVMAQCQDTTVDAIIVGEGEYAFVDLLRAMETSPKGIHQVPHVYTGQQSSRTLSSAHLSNQELAALPSPAYDLLPSKCFPVTVRFYTERGCSRQCSFCSVGEFFRGLAVPVDISTAVRDVNEVLGKYDIDHFVIGDLSMFNNTLADREFVQKLGKMANGSAFVANWWCQTRGDLLDDDAILLLKDSGCKQVAIGCEGGTDRQLKRIGKDESCKHIREALTKLVNAGIETQCYWIIGLPGDNLPDVRSTQNLIMSYLEEGLTTLTHITVLAPYPNTPAARQPRKHGIRILNTSWENYWMNCDPFGCGKPVYETIGRNGETLLSSENIYDLWLETIDMVRDFYESK